MALTPARPLDASPDGALTASQVASWREHGFALADGRLASPASRSPLRGEGS